MAGMVLVVSALTIRQTKLSALSARATNWAVPPASTVSPVGFLVITGGLLATGFSDSMGKGATSASLTVMFSVKLEGPLSVSILI